MSYVEFKSEVAEIMGHVIDDDDLNFVSWAWETEKSPVWTAIAIDHK